MEARRGRDDGGWPLIGRLPAAYRPDAYNRRPMSSRSARREPESRAEARRRARLAARGAPVEDDELDEAETEEPQQRGGILSRLFPRAGPLPGKPDPLGAFDYQGPLRPIAVRIFLLRANPLAWLGPAVVWAGARILDPPPEGLVGLPLSFLALGVAGWFGWQRPTLYGTAAAVLGYLISLAVAFSFFLSQGVAPSTFGETTQLLGELVLLGATEAGIGFLTGWYGGYLRRRSAEQASRAARPTRRR
jgi:hypothetical protein